MLVLLEYNERDVSVFYRSADEMFGEITLCRRKRRTATYSKWIHSCFDVRPRILHVLYV